MVLDINVSVVFPKGLEQTGEVRRVIDQELRATIRQVVIKIAEDARLKYPVDTGVSRASVFSNVTGGILPGQSGLQGTAGGLGATPFLEEGTRPHWPPIIALQQWAKRKFGSGSDWKTIGFLVARRIAGQSPSGKPGGTKAHHMWRKSLVKNVPFIRTKFRTVGNRIALKLRFGR